MSQITFMSDKVSVKTGKVDNSAMVSFEVGEYQVSKLKDLIGVVDNELKVTVEIL